MASFFTIFLKSFGSILKMFVLEGIMLESSTLRHFEALDCGNNFYSQSSGKLSPPLYFYPEAQGLQSRAEFCLLISTAAGGE